MNRRRRTLGTSLVEVLVVIVVFAVGILAVVQIFPRGFQTLLKTRDRSVATQLARAEIERLKARSDSLPEQILAVRRVNGSPVVDASRSPNDLGPSGNQLASTGVLYQDGNLVGPWAENSGSNHFRRIIGEGTVVPSPTQVGNYYGGLLIAGFAPLALDRRPLLYGNDFVRKVGLPRPEDQRTDTTFYIEGDEGPGATLYLPSGRLARAFRIQLTALTVVNNQIRRRDVSLRASIGAGTIDATGQYPLVAYPLNGPVTDFTRETFAGLESDTVKVARIYDQIRTNANFDGIYQYKVLDQRLGVFLISPLAAGEFIFRPEGGREPIRVRMDYDVADWRILREEFRVNADVLNPQHRLPLGNIKVPGTGEPDGRTTNGLYVEGVTSGVIEQISDPRASFLVIQDLLSGGILAERSMLRANTTLISIDKSLGLIRFFDADPNRPGVQCEVLLPQRSRTFTFDLANRPVRAYYMATGEWSVQVMKAPSSYVNTYREPGVGRYYVGGSSTFGGLTTRIYFPTMDLGRKVTVDVINLSTPAGPRQLVGQDFVIRNVPPDPRGPYIDVREVAGSNVQFDFSSGIAVRGVKGASVAVRVLQNTASFSLGNNQATNFGRLENWGRNWIRRTTETYLETGEDGQ